MIGTHALLEDQVQFADLGLVVVDEQHRFGVEQRAALTDKAGTPPHVLVMTATPIPRTVAMTVFGDLEVSTLHRAARRPRADPDQRRAARRAAGAGSTGSGSGCARRSRRATRSTSCARASSATSRSRASPTSSTSTRTATRSPTARPGLRSRPTSLAPSSPTARCAGLRVGMLHGRMPPEEKDRAMRAFAAGDIDVLVSTTVIEVGVDVANATAMVLLDADRFGVSQLHQLRGRVGRGGLPGLCLLVSRRRAGQPRRWTGSTRSPRTTDGFELSRIDLEQRREGDVLGAEPVRPALEPRQPPGAARRGDDRRGRGPRPRTCSPPTPTLSGWPLLAAEVATLGSSPSSTEFLEMS